MILIVSSQLLLHFKQVHSLPKYVQDSHSQWRPRGFLQGPDTLEGAHRLEKCLHKLPYKVHYATYIILIWPISFSYRVYGGAQNKVKNGCTSRDAKILAPVLRRSIVVNSPFPRG